MEITPANPTAAAAKTSSVVKAEPKDGGAMTSDFDTFLKLLTAQLQNQDPLKPMESTEFVAQLASFSTVEQQIRTNDQLEKIFDALGGGSPAGLAAWIGKEVRAPISVNFAGVPVRVEATPEPEAETAMLVVTNDFGDVVARRTADPKATAFTWDGKDAIGNALPHGTYSFQVESYKGEEAIGITPGEVYAKVSEVRVEDGEAVLVLEGGQKVAVDDVSALR